ncbi:DEAD/DEAH box helicase [Photobacterium leiognathi]|uniref:DEAD/DEAH box helicase n=1 Tax=Photobacterium leiognathi TaxID=553611 RepID=UPI002734027A|nr:DEAD/DEAH box helicase family protein [Photobacterium leiognathi]
MLRFWQSECISKALNHYKNGYRHFLAQATPGAGKTLMAAHLSEALFEKNMIDLVICFSPSKAVALNIQETFSTVLDCSFNGQVASLGCSMTYQSMQYLPNDFWKTISRRRVLCIFDEIHHCGGNEDSDTNSWGQTLVHDIQKSALYTLALTGTPWRSDLLPISLLSYTDPEGQVICNYQYSLKQAVNDVVCRRPNIALIDNEKVLLQNETVSDKYSSINDLLEYSNAHYACVLHNNDALNAIIGLAVKKLDTIRQTSHKAGGLIVAASIAHAQIVAQILEQQFNQSCVLVTYKEKQANNLIQAFKHSNTQWIISIGMISEGTDIPRLQVCCHLSNIRTELYFRQVLGRILRTTSSLNQEAWLYTFAESNLVRFAEQVEMDIPDSCSRISISNSSDWVDSDSGFTQEPETLNIENNHSNQPSKLIWENSNEISSSFTNARSEYSSIILGKYHTRVINAFTYD